MANRFKPLCRACETGIFLRGRRRDIMASPPAFVTAKTTQSGSSKNSGQRRPWRGRDTPRSERDTRPARALENACSHLITSALSGRTRLFVAPRAALRWPWADFLCAFSATALTPSAHGLICTNFSDEPKKRWHRRRPESPGRSGAGSRNRVLLWSYPATWEPPDDRVDPV